MVLACVAVVVLPRGAIAAGDSLYQGPGPRPGPDILYAPPATAPQLENAGDLAREADPGLRRERLPPRRVPLPGLPLRRPRGARVESRDPGDPAHVAGDSFSRAERHLHLSDEPGLRQQRRRPRRAAGQAAAERHRLPDHAQQPEGPVPGRHDDRDRQLARSLARSPTAPTPPRRRSSSSPFTATTPTCGDAATGQLVDAGATGLDLAAAAARSRCSSRIRPGTPASKPFASPPGVGLWDTSANRYLMPGRRRRRDAPGRRRGALQPHRLLQRRLPLRRALAARLPARHRVHRPRLVARPRAGHRPRPAAT